MNKSLIDKAIDLNGKIYVEVKERVLYFNETYENGSIVTTLISDGAEVVVQAKITPDVENPTRYFTGLAQEVKGSNRVNKTSAMENAETSAVGRAFAMMGIGVIDSIASIDEINKASNREYMEEQKKRVLASEAQITEIMGLMENKKYDNRGFNKLVYETWALNNINEIDTNQYARLAKILKSKEDKK